MTSTLIFAKEIQETEELLTALREFRIRRERLSFLWTHPKVAAFLIQQKRLKNLLLN